MSTCSCQPCVSGPDGRNFVQNPGDPSQCICDASSGNPCPDGQFLAADSCTCFGCSAFPGTISDPNNPFACICEATGCGIDGTGRQIFVDGACQCPQVPSDCPGTLVNVQGNELCATDPFCIANPNDTINCTVEGSMVVRVVGEGG